MGVRSYVGKAKTIPATLHMDGTSPVVIGLQMTTDELRDMHNRKVLVVLYVDDDTGEPMDPRPTHFDGDEHP